MANIKERPEGLDKPWVKTLIGRMSKANVWVYKKTGGLLGSKWRVGAAFPFGVPVLLLTTVGRKSGLERTTPLLFIRDPADEKRIVIVASTGGLPKNPAWFYNLKSNPECEIQFMRERGRYKASIASDEERARIWPHLVNHYADFANYERWTDRVIPVIFCDPA